MIDGTEKPKIPSKFAKRVARYNEFGYKTSKKVLITNDGRVEVSLKRCSSGVSVTKANKEITQNLLKGLKQFVWEVDR